MLVGDFNSYTQEDPLQMLYDAGYTDAAQRSPTEYSYSFGGLSGSLDHVLLNDAALQRATGADIWDINAEESIALEYSRYNYHGTASTTTTLPVLRPRPGGRRAREGATTPRTSDPRHQRLPRPDPATHGGGRRRGAGRSGQAAARRATRTRCSLPPAT